MARVCAGQSPPRVALAGPPPHVRGDRGAHAGPRVQHPGGGAVDAGSALLAAARPARVGPALHAHHLGRGRLLLAPQPPRVPPAARGGGGGGGVLPRGLRELRLHDGRRGRARACRRHSGLRRLLHAVGRGADAGPAAGAVGRRSGRRAVGGRRFPPRLDDAVRPRPGHRRAYRAPGTAGVHGRRGRRQPASRPRPRPGLLGAAGGGPPAPARSSLRARSVALAGHGRTARRVGIARRRRGAGGAGPGPSARRVRGGADRGRALRRPALRRPARQSPPARSRVSPRGHPVPDGAGRHHGCLPPGRVQQYGPAAADPRGRAGPRAGGAARAGGVAPRSRPSPRGRAGGAGRGRGAGRARCSALGGFRPVGAAAARAARRGGGPPVPAPRSGRWPSRQGRGRRSASACCS